MWFVLFGLGAVLVHQLPLPRLVTTWPYPPPREAIWALYFLAAALLRALILRARIERLERRRRRMTRREARFALPPPGLMEVGAGIGKGVAEAVMGNPFSAAWAGAALLLRYAASRPPEDPAAAARRAAEKKRAIARERRRAMGCIVGVGLVCVAATWMPLARQAWPRLRSVAVQTAQARGWR